LSKVFRKNELPFGIRTLPGNGIGLGGAAIFQKLQMRRIGKFRKRYGRAYLY